MFNPVFNPDVNEQDREELKNDLRLIPNLMKPKLLGFFDMRRLINSVDASHTNKERQILLLPGNGIEYVKIYFVHL